MSSKAKKQDGSNKGDQPLEQPNIGPMFRLNGLFVKDISFENPRAPEIFINPVQNQPKMGVNIDVGMKKLQNGSYEVVLRITTKAEEENKTLFLVEVQYGGVFTVNPALPEEIHSRILFVDCASVIFPFARRIISDLTSEGGFPPLLLEPINFEAIYIQKMSRVA